MIGRNYILFAAVVVLLALDAHGATNGIEVNGHPKFRSVFEYHKPTWIFDKKRQRNGPHKYEQRGNENNQPPQRPYPGKYIFDHT